MYLCFNTFSGSAGPYKLDSHGDRDVNLSIIYTTLNNKVLLYMNMNLDLSDAWKLKTETLQCFAVRRRFIYSVFFFFPPLTRSSVRHFIQI